MDHVIHDGAALAAHHALHVQSDRGFTVQSGSMTSHGGIPITLGQTAPSSHELDMECEGKDDEIDPSGDQSVKPPSFSSRALRLLEGIRGYVPEIFRQADLSLPQGVCAGLWGFHSPLERLVLGPSPIVQESVNNLATAIVFRILRDPFGQSLSFSRRSLWRLCFSLLIRVQR